MHINSAIRDNNEDVMIRGRVAILMLLQNVTHRLSTVVHVIVNYKISLKLFCCNLLFTSHETRKT